MKTDGIIAGRCEDVLPLLPAGTFRLIVTSPPYPGQRSDNRSVPEWIDWMTGIVPEMARVLTDDGVLALNVMFRRHAGWFDGRLLMHVPVLLDMSDFHLIDVYIWDRVNPVPAGNLKRHDIPTWEPVFVASKSRDYPFFPVRQPYAEKTIGKARAGNMRSSGVGRAYDGGHDDLHPEGARQGNVLRISSSGDQGRPRAKGQSFPIDLPRRFILQHTEPGDAVLDAFAGVGSTCKAAQEEGRRYLGIEMDPAEAEKARKWLAGYRFERNRPVGPRPLFAEAS